MLRAAPLLLFALLLAACGEPQMDPQASLPEDTDLPMQPPNTLTEAEQAAGWQLLFDGTAEQLANTWRSYGQDAFPASGWTAEDGHLVVRGGGGDLITRAAYGDFELTVDFLLSDTANSGIFYRVQEDPERPIWHLAPEYQLLDDATYRAVYDLTDMQYSGANYDLEAPAAAALRPVGEWNTARIVVDGTHVEHWLNGQKMVDYDIGSEAWTAQYQASKFADYADYAQATEGPIGLQDHGHEVRFRNLKIRPL